MEGEEWERGEPSVVGRRRALSEVLHFGEDDLSPGPEPEAEVNG